MLKKACAVASLTLLMAGCSTIQQLTVKEYKAKTGEKVMAGQAQPKPEFNCTQVAEEKAAYWRMDFAGDDYEKLTTTAVDNAPKNKANYAQIDMPARVNGFSTGAPTLRYFSCKNLPTTTTK